ncbi:hypothetical protein V1264_011506 [Littorina saxatilis]|uniref:Uncharacterized protein n=1 Tax=Littorina saxatilis TaxID=31220 RepID=A0AAN9BUV3_9CAEN
MPDSSVTVTSSEPVTQVTRASPLRPGDNNSSVENGGQVWGRGERVWTLGDTPWIPALVVGCGMVIFLSLSFYSHHKRVRRKRELLMDYLSTLLYSGVFTRGRSVSILCNTNFMPLSDLGRSFKIKFKDDVDPTSADYLREKYLKDLLAFSDDAKKRKKRLKRFISTPTEHKFRRVTGHMVARNKAIGGLTGLNGMGFGALGRNLSMPSEVDSCDFDFPSSLAEARKSITEGVLLDPNRVQHDPLSIQRFDTASEQCGNHSYENDGYFDHTGRPWLLNPLNGTSKAHLSVSIEGYSARAQEISHSIPPHDAWTIENPPEHSLNEPQVSSDRKEGDLSRNKSDGFKTVTVESADLEPYAKHSAQNKDADPVQTQTFPNQLMRSVSDNVPFVSAASSGEKAAAENSKKTVYNESLTPTSCVAVSVTHSSALPLYNHVFRPIRSLHYAPHAVVQSPTEDLFSPDDDLTINQNGNIPGTHLAECIGMPDTSPMYSSANDYNVCEYGDCFPGRPSRQTSNVEFQRNHHSPSAQWDNCGLTLLPFSETLNIPSSYSPYSDSWKSDTDFSSLSSDLYTKSLDEGDHTSLRSDTQNSKAAHTRSLEDNANTSPRRYRVQQRINSVGYNPLLPGELSPMLSVQTPTTFLPSAFSYNLPHANPKGSSPSPSKAFPPLRAPSLATTKKLLSKGSPKTSTGSHSFQLSKTRSILSKALSNQSTTALIPDSGTPPNIFGSVDSDPLSLTSPQKFFDLKEESETSSINNNTDSKTWVTQMFSHAEQGEGGAVGRKDREESQRGRDKERAERVMLQTSNFSVPEETLLSPQTELGPGIFTEPSSSPRISRRNQDLHDLYTESMVPLKSLSFSREGTPAVQQTSNLHRLPRFQVRSGMNQHHKLLTHHCQQGEVLDTGAFPNQEQLTDGSVWMNTPLDTSI